MIYIRGDKEDETVLYKGDDNGLYKLSPTSTKLYWAAKVYFNGFQSYLKCKIIKVLLHSPVFCPVHYATYV